MYFSNRYQNSKSQCPSPPSIYTTLNALSIERDAGIGATLLGEFAGSLELPSQLSRCSTCICMSAHLWRMSSSAPPTPTYWSPTPRGGLGTSRQVGEPTDCSWVSRGSELRGTTHYLLTTNSTTYCSPSAHCMYTQV